MPALQRQASRFKHLSLDHDERRVTGAPVARVAKTHRAQASSAVRRRQRVNFDSFDFRRMVQAPQRTAISGPTLIRLLARLTAAEVPDARPALPDRLSQWLDWTDAIKLSTALNGNPPVIASGPCGNAAAAADDAARVRATLTRAIADDSVFASTRGRSNTNAPASVDASVDYAVFRQRYLFLQREMGTAIGNLRERLRVTLAAATPAMARLAMVDAVMERALAPREQGLLGNVPQLLAGYFQRLRKVEQEAQAAAQSDAPAEPSGGTPGVAPRAWLDAFRKDMQSVLLAEMEVRFQPVEALLAALRTS